MDNCFSVFHWDGCTFTTKSHHDGCADFLAKIVEPLLLPVGIISQGDLLEEVVVVFVKALLKQ
jgi:hypothetical protein